MTAIDHQLRLAFAKPVTCYVRIQPQGFLLVPQDVPLPPEPIGRLVGRITRTQLMRKRFDDGIPVCQSRDGRIAENGTLCADCRHPACRPWLRVRLAQPRRTCILELNITSARNLFAVEDQAAAAGQRLQDWTLRLAVVQRDRWAEVRFERVTSDLPGETEAGSAEEQPAEG